MAGIVNMVSNGGGLGTSPCTTVIFDTRPTQSERAHQAFHKISKFRVNQAKIEQDTLQIKNTQKMCGFPGSCRTTERLQIS